MRIHIKHPWRLLIHCLLFSFLFLFHFAGGRLIILRSASPFLMLALLTAYSMFNSELRSLIVGAIAGTFIDSVSLAGGCFNTISLMIVCVAVSFISKYLFNVNVRSAIVLSVFSSGFYYLFRWFYCYVFLTPIEDSLIYIFEYVLPSVLFNAIFVIVFYFIEKKLYLNKLN